MIARMIWQPRGYRRGGDVVEVEAVLTSAKPATLLVHWPLAGQYVCSIWDGRLKGSHQLRNWRMHRKDLAGFRKLCGWTRYRPQPSVSPARGGP